MTESQNQLLARDAVVVDVAPMSKEEAIRYVGGLLVERGHVKPSYVDAMVEREENTSTFLGNGVAMPHGTFESKEAIVSTGIVVMQCPEGIDWGAGTAHLVIGLGAQGDDHVAILSHMAEVLQDEETAEGLWTASADELHAALNTDAVGSDDDSGVVTEDVAIANESGLHARPASLIVELAKGYDGVVTIAKGEKKAKANSIMSVLALGAVSGDTVSVEVDGPDAQSMFDQISEILTSSESAH